MHQRQYWLRSSREPEGPSTIEQVEPGTEENGPIAASQLTDHGEINANNGVRSFWTDNGIKSCNLFFKYRGFKASIYGINVSPTNACSEACFKPCAFDGNVFRSWFPGWRFSGSFLPFIVLFAEIRTLLGQKGSFSLVYPLHARLDTPVLSRSSSNPVVRRDSYAVRIFQNTVGVSLTKNRGQLSKRGLLWFSALPYGLVRLCTACIEQRDELRNVLGYFLPTMPRISLHFFVRRMPLICWSIEFIGSEKFHPWHNLCNRYVDRGGSGSFFCFECDFSGRKIRGSTEFLIQT